jgi:pyruvate dehydrogenase complex dehydrogenase (E1) component
MVEKINPAKLTYEAEGQRRMVERKQRRLDRWTAKVHLYGRGTKKCKMCGGQMSWCSCCEVWSSYCCEEYGTCQCS